MLFLGAVRRRSTALLAALALLLAQAVGLAHGVAHPQAGGFAAASAEHDHDHERSAFDGHHDEGSAQCQLLDQLSHADGVTPSLQGCAFALPATAFAVAPAAPRCAACACGYHARGPPIFLV